MYEAGNLTKVGGNETEEVEEEKRREGVFFCQEMSLELFEFGS